MIEDNILKSFEGKSCLVTGGTGLIGRQVVDILCNAGASVGSVSLDEIKLNNKVWYFFEDLTSFFTCKRITKHMDYVFTWLE